MNIQNNPIYACALEIGSRNTQWSTVVSYVHIVGTSGLISYVLKASIKISKMVLLENEAFLVELTRLFDKSRFSGSVVLTIKRFNGHNKPVPRKGRPPLPTPNEFFCLVRATLKTKKISTVIHSKDVNKFQQAYWNLLKSKVNGLKKLKKVKSAKRKIH
nr:signal recognition particle 14 kDa protein isoform X2 [Megalopta genalis]